MQACGRTPVAKGEHVEAYWPEDGTWLSAKVRAVRADGSATVLWDDGSQSEVPADYVRRPTKNGGEDAEDEDLGVDAAAALDAGEGEEDVDVEEWQEDATGEPVQEDVVVAAVEEVAKEEATKGSCRTEEPERSSKKRAAKPTQKPERSAGKLESDPQRGPPLARLRGAERDTRPAWMTKGMGIGIAMFGEGTGELLKPGLTRKDLEAIEKRGLTGPDPFGEIFGETSSGRAALEQRKQGEAPEEANNEDVEDEVADEDATQDPIFERLETVSFDGTASSAVDLPFAPEHNPSRSFSVDFWARPSGGSGYRSPVTSRDSPPPRGYAFFVTPQDRWAFWLGIPGNNEWLKVEGPRIRDGEWQRITGVFSHPGGSARLFVDGELVAQSALLVGTKKGFEANTRRPMRLGAGATEGATAKFCFTGDLRGLRIYGRAVEEPEDFGGGERVSPPPTKRRR
eukprot:TRINITY_DN68055_c0_g1_i1.p1 TRINITY_DN68055_c0_g1~~TRINITY_DN68055_c0_g1_i1.p1  ORF type:complete len:455 (+),score=115.58 TRINITY_DN68055_c0_g1_i1:80-1444(+)